MCITTFLLRKLEAAKPWQWTQGPQSSGPRLKLSVLHLQHTLPLLSLTGTCSLCSFLIKCVPCTDICISRVCFLFLQVKWGCMKNAPSSACSSQKGLPLNATIFSQYAVEVLNLSSFIWSCHILKRCAKASLLYGFYNILYIAKL